MPPPGNDNDDLVIVEPKIVKRHYLQQLDKYKIPTTRRVETPYWKGLTVIDEPSQIYTDAVEIECWELPRDGEGKYKSLKGSKLYVKGKVGYQFPVQLYNEKTDQVTTRRTMCWRVSFMKDVRRFLASDKTYTVSHLCHNTLCFNPRHHSLERLNVNKSRNGCPGGPLCTHNPVCLIPGPESNMNVDGDPSTSRSKDNEAIMERLNVNFRVSKKRKKE